MSRLPGEQKRFLKGLRSRRCPACGERMSPDAGRIGIGNPIAWRCTIPWCENRAGEDGGRLY